MRRTGLALAIAAFTCVSAPASGQTTGARTPTPIAGFLSPEKMPDVLRIVPAAPATGDSRFTADMAVYRATRSLQGSPRWAMA
jgi:acid phosphatase (class A)